MKVCFLLLTACAVAAISALAGEVTVPPLVSFSGALKDATGKPLSGVQALTFSLYTDQNSRTPVWQEKQNVEADEQGRYTVHLGAATANGVPVDLFTSGQSLWLGVQLQTNPILDQ